MSQNSHLACSLAVLLLSDDGQAVTAANIAKVIENAKIRTVEKYLPKLYASNITPEVVAATLAAGGSANSSPAPSPVAAVAAKEEKKAPVKEEKKPEKEPEEDMDMGDLFG